MKTMYNVIVRGEATEHYEIEAESAAEARLNWSDGKLVHTEVDNCAVYAVDKL